MSTGRVAYILGAGPGLGAAIASRFAVEGFDVGLVARTRKSVEAARAVVTSAGQNAAISLADLRDPDVTAGALRGMRSALGAPDVLVYNAGAFVMKGLVDTSVEDFESVWRTNCLGAFVAMHHVLPGMIERGSGTILLTGATASLRGGARFAALAVSKFGLRALAQSAAREFGPQGIHVAHVVIDGLVDNPATRKLSAGKNTADFVLPESVAEVFWQLHKQTPSAWTLELDLRPAGERF